MIVDSTIATTLILALFALSVLDSNAATATESSINGGCALSNAWCTDPIDIPSTSMLNSSSWGSFRPGTYFGMKNKNNGPSLATGIMWSSSLGAGKRLRDQTQQDELTKFEWLRHDGKRFGIESLVDNAYDMSINASFVIPEPQDHFRSDPLSEKVPEWFQTVTVIPAHGLRSDANAHSGDDKKSLLFYFGTECMDGDTAACLAEAQVQDWKVNNHKGSEERGFDSAVSVVGHSQSTGWFCLFLVAKQMPFNASTETAEEADAAASVSFAGLRGVDILRGTERVKRESELLGVGATENPSSNAGTRRGRKQLRMALFDDFGELNNEAEDQSGFVAIHVGFSRSVRVDALLYAHLDVTSESELTGLIGQAESEGAANVLPFWMCTELTVSHRSLARIPVPTGTSTAPPTSRAVVDAGGESFDTSGASSFAETAREVARTSTEVFDEDGTAQSSDGAGPLANLLCANRGDCIRDEVDQLLRKYTAAFDDHFRAVFPFEATFSDPAADEESAAEAETVSVFTENDIEAAKVCLSSVLGGMGHFRGRPSIGIAADVELDADNKALSEARLHQLIKSVNDKSSIVSLFTSTPSRTSFPRGFLWDEGFHQMLVSQWSPALSMEVISSWLQAMHFPCAEGAKDGAACVGGWIPREMILGEEAKRRVPDEFVVQRVNIANPPTFLLVVDSLLDRFASAIPPPRFAATARKQPLIDEPKGSDLFPASEELKPDEKHGDREVMRRYRKEVDPRDAQLVLLEHTADRDVVLSFLRDIYPLLHRWVQWYLQSQKGSDARPGSFRWRGRSQTDGKVIPNTLASGLDDYPRAPVASAEEHHVDLHCWMTKATAVMARLEAVLRDTEYALPPASEALALMAQYKSQHEYLLQRLDELHWSTEHHGFFDVGVNNEDAYFSQELVFRCSNPQDQSTRDILVPIEVVRQRQQDFCPPSHPKPLFPLGDGQGKYKMMERLVMQNPTLSHIPRVGYVAIFPLLLKLLDPYSPKLGAVLDMVEDPQKLWTDHGLRSIGLADKFYQRRNSEGDAPYWRGPIWIPVNFLALGALRHYATVEGVYQARAQHLYTSLRSNVLQTVLGQYASTGFFWEQYDDSTGAGMRGHPFTGWTALVVNIMAEKY